MKRRQKVSLKCNSKTGQGLVNTLINKLPFELHIPGYNYCGPGTLLDKRLARGDQGINPLDEACKAHDIAYSKTKDIKERHAADKILEEAASRRIRASDVSIGEKMAALGVKGIMKGKRKFGMGLKTKKRRRAVKKGRGVLKKQRQRVIPIPKRGGFLPFLLPLLGALGAVGGGAASIAKAVNDAKANRQKLEEQKRHNLVMEQQKQKQASGNGLYLRPYKGYGIHKKNYR